MESGGDDDDKKIANQRRRRVKKDDAVDAKEEPRQMSGEEEEKAAASDKSENETTYSMKHPGVYVTETNDRDVLQGRGSGSNLYQGNMVYRDMIEKVATSYTSTTSRKEKNRLVNELIKVIHGMNGRFLHPLDCEQIAKLGMDPLKDLYFEITDADAVDKIKQAIRYVHYKKRPLMEQMRKAAAMTGDQPPVQGDEDRTIPVVDRTRPSLVAHQRRTDSGASTNDTGNLNPEILQMLQIMSQAPSSVSASYPSNPTGDLARNALLQKNLSSVHQVQSLPSQHQTLAQQLQQLLLQQQRQSNIPSLQRTSAQQPSSLPMADATIESLIANMGGTQQQQQPEAMDLNQESVIGSQQRLPNAQQIPWMLDVVASLQRQRLQQQGQSAQASLQQLLLEQQLLELLHQMQQPQVQPNEHFFDLQQQQQQQQLLVQELNRFQQQQQQQQSNQRLDSIFYTLQQQQHLLQLQQGLFPLFAGGSGQQRLVNQQHEQLAQFGSALLSKGGKAGESVPCANESAWASDPPGIRVLQDSLSASQHHPGPKQGLSSSLMEQIQHALRQTQQEQQSASGDVSNVPPALDQLQQQLNQILWQQGRQDAGDERTNSGTSLHQDQSQSEQHVALHTSHHRAGGSCSSASVLSEEGSRNGEGKSSRRRLSRPRKKIKRQKHG